MKYRETLGIKSKEMMHIEYSFRNLILLNMKIKENKGENIMK